MSGWPDPTRPGEPLLPGEQRLHYLRLARRQDEGVIVAMWTPRRWFRAWLRGPWSVRAIERNPLAYHYLGLVPTHDEMVAMRIDAWRSLLLLPEGRRP